MGRGQGGSGLGGREALGGEGVQGGSGPRGREALGWGGRKALGPGDGEREALGQGGREALGLEDREALGLRDREALGLGDREALDQGGREALPGPGRLFVQPCREQLQSQPTYGKKIPFGFGVQVGEQFNFVFIYVRASCVWEHPRDCGRVQVALSSWNLGDLEVGPLRRLL